MATHNQTRTKPNNSQSCSCVLKPKLNETSFRKEMTGAYRQYGPGVECLWFSSPCCLQHCQCEARQCTEFLVEL